MIVPICNVMIYELFCVQRKHCYLIPNIQWVGNIT